MSYSASDGMDDVTRMIELRGYTFTDPDMDQDAEGWTFSIGAHQSESFDDGNLATVNALEHALTERELALHAAAKYVEAWIEEVDRGNDTSPEVREEQEHAGNVLDLARSVLELSPGLSASHADVLRTECGRPARAPNAEAMTALYRTALETIADLGGSMEAIGEQATSIAVATLGGTTSRRGGPEPTHQPPRAEMLAEVLRMWLERFEGAEGPRDVSDLIVQTHAALTPASRIDGALTAEGRRRMIDQLVLRVSEEDAHDLWLEALEFGRVGFAQMDDDQLLASADLWGVDVSPEWLTAEGSTARAIEAITELPREQTDLGAVDRAIAGLQLAQRLTASGEGTMTGPNAEGKPDPSLSHCISNGTHPRGRALATCTADPNLRADSVPEGAWPLPRFTIPK